MAFDETYEAGGLKWGVSEFDGAQTTAALVAAPGSGYFIQVVRAYVSKQTAGEIRLEDEDDNLVAGWVLANGGFGFLEIPGDASATGGVKLPENKALEVDTTGTDATFINVLYRVVSK